MWCTKDCLPGKVEFSVCTQTVGSRYLVTVNATANSSRASAEADGPIFAVLLAVSVDRTWYVHLDLQGTTDQVYCTFATQ